MLVMQVQLWDGSTSDATYPARYETFEAGSSVPNFSEMVGGKLGRQDAPTELDSGPLASSHFEAEKGSLALSVTHFATEMLGPNESVLVEGKGGFKCLVTNKEGQAVRKRIGKKQPTNGSLIAPY